MNVLSARNVHQALPAAVEALYKHGIERDSRNGKVLQSPVPVTTVYRRPMERVLFWPERDANPFLHLYESLWMLAGRNDIQPLKFYAKQFEAYSDDGKTMHAAYGHRWRRHFMRPYEPIDQLKIIAETLQKNPLDRRSVLCMWDPVADLGRDGKDLPCNDAATFQINPEGHLDMVVFCRSNDIVWGAYGANAVHFSILLEYMARWIGVPVGTYTQVSVNWHGYLKTLEPVAVIAGRQNIFQDPYSAGLVRALPMWHGGTSIEWVDRAIRFVLDSADGRFQTPVLESVPIDHEPFFATVYDILLAYQMHKSGRTTEAIMYLRSRDTRVDWIAAGIEWLERRERRAARPER